MTLSNIVELGGGDSRVSATLNIPIAGGDGVAMKPIKLDGQSVEMDNIVTPTRLASCTGQDNSAQL